MKVIVGLGNPGLKYARTRHNLGFWVVDELSRRFGIPLQAVKFGAKLGQGLAEGQKIMLVKPQAFMNRSGEAVGRLVNFYRLELSSLLVIYDDLDLAPGRIRLKGSGSAGGHRGVENIIRHLKSPHFPRLRLGIGQPPPEITAAAYVLQGLEADELKILKEACLRAADAVSLWLKEGLIAVMNQYNRKQTK
ncbi:MAG TPA: aminoacyl-tRNA hydrolase [Firmicutes bacterium]|nr:aminoacyl-tRNA hydrolase [Bacillota bacterium]